MDHDTLRVIKGFHGQRKLHGEGGQTTLEELAVLEPSRTDSVCAARNNDDYTDHRPFRCPCNISHLTWCAHCVDVRIGIVLLSEFPVYSCGHFCTAPHTSSLARAHVHSAATRCRWVRGWALLMQRVCDHFKKQVRGHA